MRSNSLAHPASGRKSHGVNGPAVRIDSSKGSRGNSLCMVASFWSICTPYPTPPERNLDPIMWIAAGIGLGAWQTATCEAPAHYHLARAVHYLRAQTSRI